MLIYWCLFAIFGLGALLNGYRESGRWRMLFFLLAAVPTALMIGLRWKIGPDWEAYSEIFGYTELYSFGQAIGHEDPDFMVLNWLLHQAGLPYWVLDLVCGAVLAGG